MFSPTRTLARCRSALIAAALVAVALTSGAAQDPARWPTPPARWWTVLQGGEAVTFDLRQGEHAARRVLRVERVEGSKITVALEERSPDGATLLSATRATIDATDAELVGDLTLPPGATLRRVGQETVDAGDRHLACDVYEVGVEGPRGRVTMKTWHCQQLPPVFMGGTVKLLTECEGVRATIALVEYRGKLIDVR